MLVRLHSPLTQVRRALFDQVDFVRTVISSTAANAIDIVDPLDELHSKGLRVTGGAGAVFTFNEIHQPHFGEAKNLDRRSCTGRTGTPVNYGHEY